MTAAEIVQARFERLWGQCLAQGSAEALAPFLAPEALQIAADAKQLLDTEPRQALDSLSRLIIRQQPQALICQAKALDERWSVLYGVLQAPDQALPLTMVAQAKGEGLDIRCLHIAPGLPNSGEAEAAGGWAADMGQRQEAPPASEASCRFALEAASMAIDLKGRRVDWDRDKMAAFFDLPQSDAPSLAEVYDWLTSAIIPVDREILLRQFPQSSDVLLMLANGDMLEAEFRVSHQAKGCRWLRMTMIPIKRGQELVELVAYIKDIDLAKREELRIRRQSERDSLTDLMNKGCTEACIDVYLRQYPGRGALFMIDVDNFKLVNDSFGHQAGDRVLKELGQTLASLFRGSDIVGRVGGDEFVVFMKDVTKRRTVRQKAAQIARAFHQVYHGQDGVLAISASIGIALASDDDERFAALWRRADQALYAQKRRGKNGWTFYEDLGIAESEVAGYAQAY